VLSGAASIAIVTPNTCSVNTTPSSDSACTLCIADANNVNDFTSCPRQLESCKSNCQYNWTQCATHSYSYVTPVNNGGGSIVPWQKQLTANGTTEDFELTPDLHYHIASVTGCGGTFKRDYIHDGSHHRRLYGICNFAIDTYKISTSATAEEQ